jgi:hypothetical protein
MSKILYDKYGLKYNFNEDTYIKIINDNSNKKNQTYSIQAFTSESEFVKLSNIIAIFQETNVVENKYLKISINVKNSTDNFTFWDDDQIKFSIKEKSNLFLSSNNYDLKYFYDFINYIEVEYPEKIEITEKEKDNYINNYFFFRDGSYLYIKDTIKIESLKTLEDQYLFQVYTENKLHIIRNCIAKISYNPKKSNDTLNLTINSNLIELEGIKKTDLEFNFNESGYLTANLLNDDLILKFNYFSKYFTSAWFSPNNKTILNIEGNYKPKNSSIINL